MDVYLILSLLEPACANSQYCVAGGFPRTVPAEEVIEYTNKLLSESPFKPCRTALKMPSLILDKEVRMSRFITNNALVEDPCCVEKEKSMVNPWTAEERELFIDKLAIFGKNFSKIASFLEHKTIADCIEFYYKNHKSESFERAKKKPDFTKQKKSQSSTYLISSGKRWNREVNAASLDMLGEASAIAASVNDGMGTQQRSRSRIFSGTSSSHKVPRGEDAPLQRSNSLDMYNNEIAAADVLAGICGSLSSEAMGSCITSSVDPIEGYQERKCQRISSCVKRPTTPDVTQNVDDECSDESCGEMDPSDWSDEEKSVFIQAVSSYGKDFKMISQCVRTRSREQCKVFFSKARKCLGLDKIQPALRNAASGDGNGGTSDTEDACVVQTCSVSGNDGPECKMEEDLPPKDANVSKESDSAEAHSLKPDSNGCVDNPLDSMDAEPVGKSLSTENALMNDNLALANPSGRESEVTTLAVSSKNDSLAGKKGNSSSEANRVNESDSKGVAEVSDGHCGEDIEEQRTILPEENLGHKKLQDKSPNSTEATSVSSAVNETVRYPSVNAHSPLQIGSGLDKEAAPRTCLESSRDISAEQNGLFASTESLTLFSVPNRITCSEKSRLTSVEQNGRFASMESSTLFSVPIKYQRHSSTSALSNGGTNGTTDKDSKKTVRTVNCQQHLSGYPRSDPDEFSQVLRGYPVSVQSVKESNGDVNCEKRRGNFSLQKCTGPKHQGEIQTLYPSQDKSRDQSSHSGNSSDVEKPSRNGDVKLFGKILTSSQQKPDSCVEGKGGEDQHKKPGSQTLNLRFRSDQNGNLDSSHSKFDCNNNYVGSENSVRSYGFWDGNTGFAPVPDSTVLLAKYPAAFSNHSISTVKFDHQPPFDGGGVIRSNDHSLSGLAVFPNGEMSIRNRELPPFALDMKQPQDVLFSEMPRRNGFDVVSGLQQQSRGMVGINVVSRGGLLGQCSGVSDPVAAIKMHYAKAQNLGMHSGNGVREEDTWKSNGDVGK